LGIKIEAGKNPAPKGRGSPNEVGRQNPTLDTLKKISKALEISVDDLIG